MSLLDCLFLWTIKSGEGHGEVVSTPTDALGNIQKVEVVKRPQLRAVLTYDNPNIVAKFWAVIYIAGNTLLEDIIYVLLFRAEPLGMTDWAQTTMLNLASNTDQNLKLATGRDLKAGPPLNKKLFKQYYQEIRKQKDLVKFFINESDYTDEEWDMKTESSLRADCFASNITLELIDLVCSYAIVDATKLSLIIVCCLGA